MILKVTFYRDTGKWHTEGQADVGSTQLWERYFWDTVAVRQNAVKDVRGYYCVVEDDGTGNFCRALHYYRPQPKVDPLRSEPYPCSPDYQEELEP